MQWLQQNMEEESWLVKALVKVVKITLSVKLAKIYQKCINMGNNSTTDLASCVM